MTYILEKGDRRRLKAGIRVLYHTGHRAPCSGGRLSFAERAAPRERLRREMEVAGRRLDVAMAEQALHRMEIDAGLDEMAKAWRKPWMPPRLVMPARRLARTKTRSAVRMVTWRSGRWPGKSHGAGRAIRQYARSSARSRSVSSA